MKIDKQKKIEYVKRAVFYLLGMFLIAWGVDFAVSSNLGVSPNNAVPFVLSKKFTFLSMGNWVSIIFSLFVLLQVFILWKNFKWYSIFQFVVSLAFGWFVDAAAWLDSFYLPITSNYLVRFLYIGISMALIAVGILMYLEANLMCMPAEGVAIALSKRFKKTISTCKIVFDVFLTVLSMTLSLIFFKNINGLQVTIVLAFGVGFVMKPIAKLMKKPLHNFLYGKEKEE